ncbi:MAG: LacI family DNA-binding transcriptional regulator [Pseudomonadota bacterium]
MSDREARKRSTLRDVARRSGVSVATVSRVLNAPMRVSQATRERVQSAITELRFFPSAAARAINSGRTRLVGALVPTLDNAIFARFLEALEGGLAERGLSLVVATTNGDPEREAAKAQSLIDCGAEGLVLSGVTRAASFDALVERAQMPVIATSYFDPDYRYPTIGYENGTVARIALSHLIDLGHREIAVLHGPVHNNDRTRARLQGLEPPKNITLSHWETDLSVGGGSAAVDRLLSGHMPTAILCLSDVLATGALYALHRHGIAVPEQTSVMGIDDLPSSAFTRPALTTVRLQVREMGAATAEALADWIEEGHRPEPRDLGPKLIVRETAAPPGCGCQ